MASQTIFGIDLGTTNSCIAYVDEFGRAVVVPNSESDNTTPSVVFFETATNIVVGKEANNSAVAKPDSVVSMVKRHMGEDPPWSFSFGGTNYSAEEISAYILKKVVGDAALAVGHAITDVVITCPAYFGMPEREATARAGQIAGLNVLEIINEPTAAAIAYGIQDQQDQVVLVYDLGGGTFDITMIEIKNKSIRVIATGGDHHLGGHDWDAIIVNYLAQEWMNETGSSDNPLDSAETLQDLWLKAEGAKRSLSSREETRITFGHAGTNGTVTLTRAKFDELTMQLLERTIAYTKDTLDIARQLGFAKFDQLLLVGGSTKMLQVQQRLKSEFSVEPQVFDPDMSVAKGAAIYGQKLAIGERIKYELATQMGTTPDKIDLDSAPPDKLWQAEAKVAGETGRSVSDIRGIRSQTITNVLSHSFGIIALADSQREIISNIVRVNTPLPHSATERYSTVDPGQSTVLIRIVQNEVMAGEVNDISQGKEIGNAVLEMPPGLPAGAPVEVTFEIDGQGRLHMTARELTNGRTIEATLQTDQMSDAEAAAAQQRAERARVS